MQQIEEVKRGQVVCYRTNGVYTYGLVLGVSDKEFQKMSDVETKSLRSIKAGIYYLCNYSTKLNCKEVKDMFLSLLSSLVRNTLNNTLDVRNIKEVSVSSLYATETAVKEEEILIWITKSSIMNQSVSGAVANLKDVNEVLAKYKELKSEREKYIDEEQKEAFLSMVKKAIRANGNILAKEFKVGNIYLIKASPTNLFVVPLENDRYIEFRPPKTNSWAILALDKKLEYYKSRCIIRKRYYDSYSYRTGKMCVLDIFNINTNRNLYDIGVSLFDLPYNVIKLQEIVKKYG